MKGSHRLARIVAKLDAKAPADQGLSIRSIAEALAERVYNPRLFMGSSE